MDKSAPKSISVMAYLPTALILAGLGWGGIFAVIQLTSPSGGTRWLLFLGLILAFTGTFLPLVAFLNKRVSSPPPSNLVIMRQALWFGVYASILAWLQIGRVLTTTMALLLALGLIIIEGLLRLRERSQWKT